MGFLDFLLEPVQMIGQHFLNKDASKYSNGLQLQSSKELFDYQNAYNNPKEQVQRLQAAGISPWTMSGNSQVASMPSGGSATMTPVDIASVRLINSQARKTNAEAKQTEDLLEYLIDELALKNRGQELENEFNEQTLENRIEQVATTLQMTQSQHEAVKQDLLQNSRIYPLVIRDMNQQFKNLKKKYQLDDEDLKRKKHETKIAEFEKDIKEVSQKIASNYGVTPDADGLKAIVQAIISGHGADVIEHIVQGLVQTGYRTTKRLIKNPLKYIIGDVDE